jgi:hypothetical protein
VQAPAGSPADCIMSTTGLPTPVASTKTWQR